MEQLRQFHGPTLGFGLSPADAHHKAHVDSAVSATPQATGCNATVAENARGIRPNSDFNWNSEVLLSWDFLNKIRAGLQGHPIGGEQLELVLLPSSNQVASQIRKLSLENTEI